jgi:hypothetical protein
VVVDVVGDEEAARRVEHQVFAAADAVAQARDELAREDGTCGLVHRQKAVGDGVGVVPEEGVQDARAGLDCETTDVVADAVEHDAGHGPDDGDDVRPGDGDRGDVELHEHRDAEWSEVGVVAGEVGHRAFEREGLSEGTDVAKRPVVVPLELAVVRERRDGIRVVADREEHPVVFVDAPQRGNRRCHRRENAQQGREQHAGYGAREPLRRHDCLLRVAKLP